MSLFDLFFEFGNPADTYTDDLVAAFYTRVDQDGSWFAEALAEMPDSSRTAITQMINDPTSRSLSHQMIGRLVVDQLRKYPRKYLNEQFLEKRALIDTAKMIAARAAEADLDNDGQQTGCLP